MLEKKKRRLFTIATLAVGVVIGLLAAEIGLRIVGFSSPEFYEADLDLGYRLIPGISGTYTTEGRSFVSINSEGYRDIEHSIEKPPGTVRIAIIGDSYVEGLQVEQDEVFTNFVGAGLSACGAFGGKRIEILNFGVSGYGTGQELLMLQSDVWKYSPDVIVLIVTTNNDVTDNVSKFKGTPIPYFVLRDGELHRDDGFRTERRFVTRNSTLAEAGVWLKNHLRVVQAGGEIARKLKYRFDQKAPVTGSAEETAAKAVNVEVGIDNQIYREPADEDWENAWAVTEALILKMKEEVEDHGARFIVVTGSNGAQVLPDVEARKGFAKWLGADDLLYPDRRIARFGEANSISVITLSQILGDHAARENVFLHGVDANIGYGHWNRLGHRVAGEAIAARLCEKGEW